MDNNAAAALMVALTGLQNIVAALREGRIASLLTFGRWADEDVRKFI